MTWTKVECQRDGCPGLFTVDDDLDERRCPKCGLTHYSPWDDPEADATVSSGEMVPRPDSTEESHQSGAQRRGAATEHSHGSRACQRCGTRYDPDRERSRSYLDSSRCPSCGCKNESGEAPATTPEQPARADGGVPDVVGDVVEQVDTDGKELHFHVHNHQD